MSRWRPSVTVAAVIERGGKFLFVEEEAGGRRVPEDVAVVGFDDQNLAAVIYPPLTTVHTPTAEVGRAAAEQLLRLIRTEQADLLTLLPTEIVIRRSCGCNNGTH